MWYKLVNYVVDEVVYDVDMLTKKIVRNGFIDKVFTDGSFIVKFEDKKLGVMCNSKGWIWNGGKVWKKEELPSKLIEDLEEKEREKLK